mgnify:FL=1
MVELSREQFEAFMSKTDFDFSTPAGWDAFLAERSQGGTGRDADGLQLRDIKNYAVGTAFVNTVGQPVRVDIHVRTMGSGLALPPGILYVYHPDASWKKKVTSFYVGPPSSSLDFQLQAGGGGTPTRPEWGSLYYIVMKSGEIPGRGMARRAAEHALRDAFKSAGWFFTRGFKMLSRGEAGYSVSVKVGANPVVRDSFMPQKIFSDEAQERLRQMGQRAMSTLPDR